MQHGDVHLALRIMVAEAVQRDVDVDRAYVVHARRRAARARLARPGAGDGKLRRRDGEDPRRGEQEGRDRALERGARAARRGHRPALAGGRPPRAGGAPRRPRGRVEGIAQRAPAGADHGRWRTIAAAATEARRNSAAKAARASRPMCNAHGSSAWAWVWPKATPWRGLLSPRTTLTDVAVSTATSAVPATGPGSPGRRSTIRRQTRRPAQTAKNTSGSASVPSRSQCTSSGGSLTSRAPWAWWRTFIQSTPP